MESGDQICKCPKYYAGKFCEINAGKCSVKKLYLAETLFYDLIQDF